MLITLRSKRILRSFISQLFFITAFCIKSYYDFPSALDHRVPLLGLNNSYIYACMQFSQGTCLDSPWNAQMLITTNIQYNYYTSICIMTSLCFCLLVQVHMNWNNLSARVRGYTFSSAATKISQWLLKISYSYRCGIRTSLF